MTPPTADTARPKRKRLSWRRWTELSVTHLLAAGASLLFVYPLIWLGASSIKANWEIYRAPLSLLPFEGPQLDVYREIFRSTPVPLYVANSLIYAFGALLLTLVFALVAAYGLSRFRFTGKRPLLIIILAVQLVPGLVRLVPLYLLVRTLGLYNERFGIILIYGAMSIPFAIWFLKGYLDTVPTELDESAAIDGASRLRILFQIIAPTIVPGLASLAILQFISHWNEFQLASVLLRNPDLQPLTVGTYNLIGPDESDFRLIAAASLVNIVPVLVVFAVLQRYLVAGLASGSVKG